MVLPIVTSSGPFRAAGLGVSVLLLVAGPLGRWPAVTPVVKQFRLPVSKLSVYTTTVCTCMSVTLPAWVFCHAGNPRAGVCLHGTFDPERWPDQLTVQVLSFLQVWPQ